MLPRLAMRRASAVPPAWTVAPALRPTASRAERAHAGRSPAGAQPTSSSSSSSPAAAASTTGRATSTRTPPPPPWTPSPDPLAHAWHRPDLALVLVHPVIPHNTGATARTCAAAGVPLHLVGPIGFSLADKGLRRAGLDYWPAVAVALHEDWAAFVASLDEGPGARLVAFSKLGTTHHAEEGLYAPPPGGRTYLLFGAETTGLPPEAHAAADAVARIPIVTREVRSLNLAVSAGVGLFEAVRQLDGAVLSVA